MVRGPMIAEVTAGWRVTNAPAIWMRVQAELEAILGARVDLVPANDLKPAVRARAEPELVAL